MRVFISLVSLIAAGCAGNQAASDEEMHQAIVKCAETAELREGESLGNQFRERAALAHCQKTLTADDEG